MIREKDALVFTCWLDLLPPSLLFACCPRPPPDSKGVLLEDACDVVGITQKFRNSYWARLDLGLEGGSWQWLAVTGPSPCGTT